MWKIVNKIKGELSHRPAPPFKVDKPKEVAQVFAENFSEKCSSSATVQQDLYEKSQSKLKWTFISKGMEHQGDFHPRGIKGITRFAMTIPMINRMTDASLSTLLPSCNMLLEAHEYPDSWRRETKLPIGKPSRDPCDVGSYQSISQAMFASCLSACSTPDLSGF